MPTWKQLTPITAPSKEVGFWVNLDNACFISPGVVSGAGAHIEFVSTDPVEVKETSDQIVTPGGNWKEYHFGSEVIFVNVANITTVNVSRSVRGGQPVTFISFALAPSYLDASGEAQEPRLVSCTVQENPAQAARGGQRRAGKLKAAGRRRPRR